VYLASLTPSFSWAQEKSNWLSDLQNRENQGETRICPFKGISCSNSLSLL
jgi:hypothetical protein